MWSLDLAFADVVSTSSDPALGAIRLAWWRERLDELDRRAAPPAEPRLQAIADALLPASIEGGELSALEDGWLPLLAPFPWGDEQADALRLRGRILFGIGARLLHGSPDAAAVAGALWSLVDGASHCSDPQSRQFLLAEARAAVSEVPARMPRNLRPLTVLASLATIDLLRGGKGRGRAALAHRLFGTMPR